MNNRLLALGQAAVQKRQRQRIARIVTELEAKVAGIAAEATPSGVVVSGTALVRRWLSDPALRFVGTMTK